MKAKVSIPIFFGDLVITQTKSLKWVGKKYGYEIGDEAALAFSEPYKNGVSRYFLCFKKGDTILKDVIHECYHLVRFICNERGIDFQNDEVGAYIIGWAYEQCVKHLKLNECTQKNS